MSSTRLPASFYIRGVDDPVNVVAMMDEMEDGGIFENFYDSDMDELDDPGFEPDHPHGTLNPELVEEDEEVEPAQLPVEQTVYTGPKAKRRRTDVPTRNSSNGGTRAPDSTTWEWLPTENARPQPIEFSGNPGPRSRHGGHLSVIDAFLAYFTSSVWSLLVKMTNLNASMRFVKLPNSRDWTDVTVEEMKAYIGMLITMGVLRLPTIKHYWRRKHWVLRVVSFSDVMSRDRFHQITSFLHFNDDARYNATDKLFKIRPLLDLIVPRFRSEYKPGKNVSIDESMIPFKGKLGFRQFMPCKRVRYGIKVWAMAESNTGYICNLQVYTGKQAESSGEVSLSARVVNDLMEPFQHVGHHLYVDNFYTSPDLFLSLYQKGTYACGTLRKGRRGFPKEIELTARQPRGHSSWVMSGPVLAQSWMDSKPVYFLSTIHSPNYAPSESVRTVKRRKGRHDTSAVEVACPPLLSDYNHHMGGVDSNDQQRKYYNLGRRSLRWYRRIFFYLLEVAIHNAFVLRKAVEGSSESALKFREQLVIDLIGDIRVQRRSQLVSEEARLLPGAHWPINNLDDRRLVCVVCSKKKSHGTLEGGVGKTRTQCELCNAPLCNSLTHKTCFKDYHTKKMYW